MLQMLSMADVASVAISSQVRDLGEREVSAKREVSAEREVLTILMMSSTCSSLRCAPFSLGV